MMWNLPLAVEIDGIEYPIRNRCDYRVVLNVICALNDVELDLQHRVECALFLFYGNDEDLVTLDAVLCRLGANIQTAVSEMFKIINLGKEETESANDQKPQLMDWEQDFPHLAPPISRVLGYSVRDENRYTHWYDFLGAYTEIGECVFATIVSIRSKKLKGKKLDDWEKEFYNENRHLVDLQPNLTEEEKEWLNSDW